MINYSIIIPHKNTPDLLQKCLDSIPRRNDVQVIVVDDNSDEDKVDFGKFPGLHDEHIEVYLTKEGKGAGYARNVGLSHAQGKWIVFADADDFFTDCFNDVLNEFVDKEYDVAFFKGTAINLIDGSPSSRGEIFNHTVDAAIATGDFTEALLQSTSVRKFYSAKFIKQHNIRFNEVRWSNDVVFSAWVAYYAQKYIASDKVIYCVTESNNSLTRDISLECRVVRFKEKCKEVRITKKKYPQDKSICYWLFFDWFNVYRTNKIVGLKLLPQSIYYGRFEFVREVIKQYMKKWD